MVLGEGIEPSHCCQYGILSPARLPVPPSQRNGAVSLLCIFASNFYYIACQK